MIQGNFASQRFHRITLPRNTEPVGSSSVHLLHYGAKKTPHCFRSLFDSVVEMMGFDSRANYALGLPRSRTSTGSSLCTVSPSNPLRWVTDFSKNLLLGGDDGIRTHDPLLAGQVLSQLSYTPINGILLLSPFFLDLRKKQIALLSPFVKCWH